VGLLLQLLLGGAASGWLQQQDVAALSDMLSASMAAGSDGQQVLQVLQDKQLLPHPSQVRKAFYVLLHQQSAPQGKAASALATVQGQLVPAAVCVQRCLAYLNWALYEATVGEMQRAGSILLAAVLEARDQKHRGLLALLQHHFLVLLARLDGMAAATAGRARADNCNTGGAAASAASLASKDTAGSSSNVVQVLHAIISGTVVSGDGTAAGRIVTAPALQYPELSFSSQQLSQRLLGPPLLDDAVLEGNVQGWLALLPRKQVCWQQLASACNCKQRAYCCSACHSCCSSIPGPRMPGHLALSAV
jgi:hypothetical protein